MMNCFIRSTLLMVVFTIALGLIYPFLVFVGGNLFFKNQATGSFIEKDGHIVGSSLIGQAFTLDKYFHSRLSGSNYDAMNSGSSNASISSDKFYERIKKSEESYKKENNLSNEIIPIDALTESASGLDPHISKENAYIQAKRVSRIRNIPQQKVLELIDAKLESPFLNIMGNERVNVLLLNLALDELEKK